MVTRHGMMEGMGRAWVGLVLVLACGDDAVVMGTDGGSPFAPCGLELAPEWRVTAIDVTVDDRTDDGLISQGVDLDGTTERVCRFDDAVDPEGREGVDDLLGAIEQITGTADPLVVSGDFDPLLREVDREGRCTSEVELGAITATAVGGPTSWRAGPMGAVFVDFALEGVETQIPVRDSWLVMRDGELHLTGGISHESLFLFFQEVAPGNDFALRIIAEMADLDMDGDGICERTSVVFDVEPR
jgi:hypothetical protein